jgi:hypothetical protein
MAQAFFVSGDLSSGAFWLFTEAPKQGAELSGSAGWENPMGFPTGKRGDWEW